MAPIAREHAAEMFGILNDPTLYEFTGGTPPPDADSLSHLYEFWEKRQSPDGTQLWLNWVLRERESRALIGYVQATVNAGFAQVAWVVGTWWQRRGYAFEAASALIEWLIGIGVRDIRASMHPRHLASIKVAERAGLVRTDEMVGAEGVWKLIASDVSFGPPAQRK